MRAAGPAPGCQIGNEAARREPPCHHSAVKTFLLLVVFTVGAGLGLRYLLHRHHHDDAPPPPIVEHQAPPPVPEPTPPPTPAPPPPAPEPPPPPRIAGSKLVSDASVEHFAAAPGVIYYCAGDSVMAQAKAGWPSQAVGDCNGAFDFVADAEGVFYCDQRRVMRITAGTQGSHVVVDDIDCIMEALDAKYAYFVVPGFEDIPNPGVYRVPRVGGKPERIYTSQPHEQFMLAVDDEALWIGAFGAGSITKLPKTPGASPRAVVTGQKGIVSVGVDATYLYWYAQATNEVRRRKKTGGAVEVLSKTGQGDTVLDIGGHVYWLDGGDATTLEHLAPGADKPEALASGLHTPSVRADAEGAYVTELDRDGIFMFGR